MMTAPLVDHAARRPVPARGRAASSDTAVAAYAASRLGSTVWGRAPALAVYRGLLRLGGWLAARGVSADAMTLFSVVLAAVSGVSAALGYFTLAAVMVLASGAADALDGAVARAAGTSSRYGALLDSTVDRLSDGLPLLGVAIFYAGTGTLAAVPAAAMMAAFLVSYVRARAESLGARLPPLFMRRTERVVLLVLVFLLAPVGFGGFPVPAPLLLLGVAVLGAMSFAGALAALRSARIALSGPRVPSVTEPSE
jgi:CDP-diacylglycerol---glycerol-3-phosphate 3-phosphatidyltransferase